MTTYKTPPSTNSTPRVRLAVGETGSLGIGTPLKVTRFPLASDTNDIHDVKVCPDDERPDGVVMSSLDEVSTGTMAYLDSPRLPLRIGGTGTVVAAATPSTAPLLKVNSGRWIPAGTGQKGYVRPYVADGVAIAAGDIVNGFASFGTA